MTPLETTLISLGCSVLAGSGVKVWEKRNAVSPEQCRQNHKKDDEKYKSLEKKINAQTKMIRSLVTHTISDKDKQEEILNINGGTQ